MANVIDTPDLQPIIKLNRDAVKAIMNIGRGDGETPKRMGCTTNEARYLVDLYYQIQKLRVSTNNRVKGLQRDAQKQDTKPEPHEYLDLTHSQATILEDNIRKILSYYVETNPMAPFFEVTLGIGPVISAGLLAGIDFTIAPTAGHIWRFCGLDPSVKWEKGKKRPWNAALKRLCYLIGESFVKLSSREDCFYGRQYVENKRYYWRKNLSGDYASQCPDYMTAKRFGDDTDAKAWYSGQCDPRIAESILASGDTPTAAKCRCDTGGLPMLPPAQIHRRATRRTVKLFLSHMHECWYRLVGPDGEGGHEPPVPYAVSILGHAHYIPPPQLPLIDLIT